MYMVRFQEHRISIHVKREREREREREGGGGGVSKLSVYDLNVDAFSRLHTKNSFCSETFEKSMAQWWLGSI